ncbi:MAG: hypothetical protein U9Q97_04760 [Acidobacteriota bacterium]|nr:hypothetical protein [Acidobacteriota bacterium]
MKCCFKEKEIKPKSWDKVIKFYEEEGITDRYPKVCPNCKGTGEAGREHCPGCLGRGWVVVMERK